MFYVIFSNWFDTTVFILAIAPSILLVISLVRTPWDLTEQLLAAIHDLAKWCLRGAYLYITHVLLGLLTIPNFLRFGVWAYAFRPLMVALGVNAVLITVYTYYMWYLAAKGRRV